MLNRKAKPTIAPQDRCPKCGALLLPDYSWAHGRIDFSGWHCLACGLTSESTIFLDAIKKRVVEINE